MGFERMSMWNWAESYGHDDPLVWSKGFRKKIFLGGQPLGEKFYIKCKYSLEPLPRKPNVIAQAWDYAEESMRYYGGTVRHKKDVTNEGFNFYSPDGKNQVFVKFDDLVAIVRLEDNKNKKIIS
jgi:hypothetical protein